MDPSVFMSAFIVFLIWMFISEDAAGRSTWVLVISQCARFIPFRRKDLPLLAALVCPDPPSTTHRVWGTEGAPADEFERCATREIFGWVDLRYFLQTYLPAYGGSVTHAVLLSTFCTMEAYKNTHKHALLNSLPLY